MTGDEFKAIRKRLGYKQAELAALLGYGSSIRVSEFERTTNPIPVPRLVALLMMAMDETGWRPPSD
ncbi:helix-turn-helix domain-containing protein [Shinella sp. M31]|uniref:helix-turn-helix domain-containing protein n=1 Tax=Shinella sp. M31 TaxID=3368615 RepID=UPI003BA0E21E